MMETISFKLQEGVLKKIDKFLQPLHFNNRTEFIREAIRDKLNKIEKDVVLLELKNFKGAAKKSVSDKRLHEIREEVAKKYAKNFGIELD